ncbi:MAG: (5-formylfuran-3-yl)methyl phosphate synthase [Gammaproteobacteria bacterium]|nr:(5-formylfuran-3-yl)methyl phosphate synthase [Gammaproteobacteria bacterium]MCI0590054.1 (5-formylfuran-3-yl)methyl phosphate synthase [Gammaproteobacteria bacterium]
MTGMLASVATADEARIVLQGGADIIDLKDPRQGTLGAVAKELIRQVVRLVGGRRLVSATVGDLPMEREIVVPALSDTAAIGVDIVKVGLFARHIGSDLLDGLRMEARRGVRIVAVLFADLDACMSTLMRLKDAGLWGVMLDTAQKGKGSLREKMPDDELQEFVSEARACNLVCGLAGSLGLDDIAPLLALKPDYLGFRGALCTHRQRDGVLDAAAVAAIRARMRMAGATITVSHPDNEASVQPEALRCVVG